MTDFLQKLAKSATKITKAEMYNRLDYFDDYLFLIVIVIVITRKIFKNNRDHNRNHLKKFGIPNRNSIVIVIEKYDFFAIDPDKTCNVK
jgi:hypothetical protein